MSAGYIYIRNWDQYQYRTDRRLPWIKLYAELLDDDDYLRLSLADRGTLQDLWKLASLSGEGRVSADRVSLARRLNVRRVSLEPLIQAGFIEIRAQKRRRQGALEEEVEGDLDLDIKPPTPFEDETNGSRPSRAKRKAPAETPEEAATRHRVVRELLPSLMCDRWVSDAVLDMLHPADCKPLIAAWGRSNDLRDAGRAIEEAANPRAYALAVAGHRTEHA